MKKRTKHHKLNKGSTKPPIPIILAVAMSIIIVTAIYLIINHTPDEMNQNIEQISNDFPSNEAGTLEGWIQSSVIPPQKSVVLFSSGKIPGLAIVYYPHDHKMIAGVPPLIAEGVDVLDGKEHQLIYTFQQGGSQALLIDNNVVASGKYEVYSGSGITGMVVGATVGKASNIFNKLEFK